MNTKIIICMGTSGISAGADKVKATFISELEKHNLSDKCTIITAGDRGLFRDVLVDIVTQKQGKIIYEHVKPEDVSEIVEKHLVNGEKAKRLQAGKDYEDFFAGQTRVVLANCGEINPENIDDYISNGGYSALMKIFNMTHYVIVADFIK